MSENENKHEPASLRTVIEHLDRLCTAVEAFNERMDKIVEAIDDGTNTMEEDLKWIRTHLSRRP